MAKINWHEQKELDEVYIRNERKKAFKLIDKSVLWYESLKPKEKTELDKWYKAWLDAPVTMVIPEKPEWLQ